MYLVHEVTTLMDMILNGERGRKANHKMTGIGRRFCVQISESDQSFCVFSVTPTLLPLCHHVFIVFG